MYDWNSLFNSLTKMKTSNSKKFPEKNHNKADEVDKQSAADSSEKEAIENP